MSKQRWRSKKTKQGGRRAIQPSSEQYDAFAGATKELIEAVAIGLTVSDTMNGKSTDTAGLYSSCLFAKMVVHGSSIQHVAETIPFDYSGILGLARMVVEAAVTTAYISESVVDIERQFRLQLLALHDTVARQKFFRGIRDNGDNDDFQQLRLEQCRKLMDNPKFGALSEPKRKRLLRGSDIFVDSLRSAAQASLGWNPERFSAIYGYLSAHAHSGPMSFFRTRELYVVVTFETGWSEIQRRIWPIWLVDTRRRFCGVASAGVRGFVV